MLKKIRRPLVQFYRRNVRYLGWRLRNPTRPYSDYYVDVVMNKLGSGRNHPAIGSEVVAGSHSTELIDYLKERGLQPHHTVVDYGCGSLRLGQYLIEYLDPGKYWGVDITDQFYLMGLSKLPQALLDQKQPKLDVISDRSVAAAAAAAPDFVAAWHVLSKVPEDVLPQFFGNIAKMLKPGAQAFIHFPECAVRTKVSAMSWATPRSLLRDVIAKVAPDIEVEFSLYKPGGRPEIQMSVVEMRRPAAAMRAAG